MPTIIPSSITTTASSSPCGVTTRRELRACTIKLIMQGNPQFMQQAISLATENVTSGRGGPVGAGVVKDGRVIATGTNQVTASNDPTAHAEVVAVRNACTALGTFKLD